MSLSVKEAICELKNKKNAIVLAHYYVPDEVQEVADFIGDSFFLSKKAKELSKNVIVFCGVSFMAESAKILNPEKMVLMPDVDADCAMAHMVEFENIKRARAEYEDLAVVCYINSTTEVKAVSDVCVTSANAVDIVRKLPNDNILFVPDGNLGRYVAEQIPEKNIILNPGFCPIHNSFSLEEVKRAQEKHPNAQFLVHPECVKELLDEADYIGSTAGIIKYVASSEHKEFIIGTEQGVLYELKRQNPDKNFYMIREEQICRDMKYITLEKVLQALENEAHQVQIDEALQKAALKPLDRMLELAK